MEMQKEWSKSSKYDILFHTRASLWQFASFMNWFLHDPEILGELLK